MVAKGQSLPLLAGEAKPVMVAITTVHGWEDHPAQAALCAMRAMH
jgi:hypothetical protein